MIVSTYCSCGCILPVPTGDDGEETPPVPGGVRPLAKNGDDADGESYVDLPRGDDRGGVWILDKSTDLGDQFICGEDGVKCEVFNCLLGVCGGQS